MGFLKKFLLRMARKVLEGVLSQLTRQLNIIQDQALSPMRTIVNSITDEVWRGEGAEAFKEEVSGLMIPGVGQVAEHITAISANIRFAMDVIDRADEEVNKKVLTVADLFDAIS
jgi:uncharacterized protein YukE